MTVKNDIMSLFVSSDIQGNTSRISGDLSAINFFFKIYFIN